MARRAYPTLTDPVVPVTNPSRFFARIGEIFDYFSAVIEYHWEYDFTLNRIALTSLWVVVTYISLYQWERDPDVNTRRLGGWTLLALLVLGITLSRNVSKLFLMRDIYRRIPVGFLAASLLVGRGIVGTGLGFAEEALDYLGQSNLARDYDTWVAVALPLVMIYAGSKAIGIAASFALAAMTAFVALPVFIFNQLVQLDEGLTRYRFQADGLVGYFLRAVGWARSIPPAEPLPDESKGARFSTPAEAAALQSVANPESMAFGHLPVPGRGSMPYLLHTKKHVLIMASTRSGKGVTLIIPHLLRYQGSAFILDPKGENARATGRRRGQLNDQVHYLDPFGISGKPKSRFNPLSRFTLENMEQESKALAAAMFLVGERERDHWTAAGQQLLALFVLYVYLSPVIPPGRKDLPAVRKLLLGAVAESLEDMKTMIDVAGGLLYDLATSFSSTDANKKEMASIISTAQRQTEILDNPYIAACLSASGDGRELNFSDWHTGTMSVFLCLSAPRFPVFNRWLRLVLTSALDEMTDRLKPPPLPVCFMLDELATLGHLPSIENAIGLAAGYGIQLVCVFQDVAQMKDLYKGRWASFIGNSGVRAVFNIDDFDTADYWSKFMGGRIAQTVSEKQDMYGIKSGDQNLGEAIRPLCSTEELMFDYASGKMLVLAQGAHPVVTDRIWYKGDRSLNWLWDDPDADPVEAAAKAAPQATERPETASGEPGPVATPDKPATPPPLPPTARMQPPPPRPPERRIRS